ncbi:MULTISPECIES: hypothetical protein [unclassified Streptomyces]|uniref:hypothetical protein n=1 Tax=unclassified Streptomyces TaxID=2593676 RepID=UPI0036EB212B
MGGFEGQVWRLHSGGEPIGEILIDGADFPWLSGRFRATPAFTPLRELFARELALMEGEEIEKWERVYDEVRRRVSLTSPDGPVPEFLLHIEGDAAWFRWSEEPFDD